MRRHDFSGKKVLITGASTGIGRALAVEFAKRRAVLALNTLPKEEDLLVELAGELKNDYGTQTALYPGDLVKAGAPEALYAAVKKKFGVPYALVNNAGTVTYGKVWESDTDEQMRVYRLNLEVPFRLVRPVVPDTLAAKRGVVLNVSSVAAFQPTPFRAVYGSAKAGLRMLSEATRAELMGTGVSICTPLIPAIPTRPS